MHLGKKTEWKQTKISVHLGMKTEWKQTKLSGVTFCFIFFRESGKYRNHGKKTMKTYLLKTNTQWKKDFCLNQRTLEHGEKLKQPEYTKLI
jgi:hypothetical protein